MRIFLKNWLKLKRKPKVVPFIFNWRNQFDNTLKLEHALGKLLGKVIVINSDPTVTREGWVNLDDEAFFTEQFFKAIEVFDGDILFHLQADASYHDWNAVLRNALHSFSVHHWGVFAPNVDWTAWVSNGVEFDSSFRLVSCTDCTCWFIHKDIIAQFNKHRHLFEFSKFGWGIDVIMAAISYSIGRPVIRDYSHTIVHPKGRGYDTEFAKAEYDKFLENANPELASVLNRVLSDESSLVEYLS